MVTMSATDAKNKIGELWELASKEPVTIERNGKAQYMIVPVDTYVAVLRSDYERLRAGEDRPPRQIGFAKELFAGADVNALLDVDLTEAMREYI